MKPFDAKQSGVRSVTDSKPQSQAEAESELEGHFRPGGLSSSKGQGQPQPPGQVLHQAGAQVQADAIARAPLQAQAPLQAPSQKQVQPTAHTQPAAQPESTAQSTPTAQPQPAKQSKPTAQPQPAKQSKPAAQPQPATQSQPKAQLQPQTQPKPTAQPKPLAQSKTAAQPQPAAQPILTLKLLRDIFDEREENVDILSADLDGIRKELHPFNSWKDRGVMLKDYRRETKYVDELVKLAKPMKNARSQLRMVALAAKNRAEAISDKSDFYPASIAFVTSVFAMLVIFSFEKEFIKWAFAILTPVLAFIFVFIRINTRRQVANLKIVGNILDAVEKQIPDSPKEPAVQKGTNQGRAKRRWLCAPISTNAKAKPTKAQLRRKNRS